MRVLHTLLGHSITYRIAVGPRAVRLPHEGSGRYATG